MQKKVTARGVWKLLTCAVRGFNDDKVFKLSAALAYYTVFSIGPMIIVIIFLAGIFYGREAIRGSIFTELDGLIGEKAALQVQEVIKGAVWSDKGPVAATLGIITLLIGATTVFAEIQDSINDIWGVKAKPKKGWIKMIMNRILSFSIVVTLGFIMLVSLVINGVIEALMNRLQERFPELTVVVLYVLNLLITIGVITCLFAIIFRVLPDARIKWKDVMIGAVVTSVLFLVGKFGITFYISSSDIGSTYGAAGSLVILLLWVYYSSIILYFGAEFTKAWATEYGTPIHPNEYAVWVKHIEVEEESGTLRQQEKQKQKENNQTGDDVKVT
jgi:membrane protein